AHRLPAPLAGGRFGSRAEEAIELLDVPLQEGPLRFQPRRFHPEVVPESSHLARFEPFHHGELLFDVAREHRDLLEPPPLRLARGLEGRERLGDPLVPRRSTADPAPLVARRTGLAVGRPLPEMTDVVADPDHAEEGNPLPYREQLLVPTLELEAESAGAAQRRFRLLDLAIGRPVGLEEVRER